MFELNLGYELGMDMNSRGSGGGMGVNYSYAGYNDMGGICDACSAR